MRLSTVTILAFIAYTGNQAMAAPIPGSSQSLGLHEPHQVYHHGHRLYSHAKHAYGHITAQEDEESAEQIAELGDSESSHLSHAGGQYRYRHHQAHGFKSPDTPKTQDLSSHGHGRGDRAYSRGEDEGYTPPNPKHDFQAIEARSPGRHSQRRYPPKNRKRDLQVIEARFRSGNFRTGTPKGA